MWTTQKVGAKMFSEEGCRVADVAASIESNQTHFTEQWREACKGDGSGVALTHLHTLGCNLHSYSSVRYDQADKRRIEVHWSLSTDADTTQFRLQLLPIHLQPLDRFLTQTDHFVASNSIIGECRCLHRKRTIRRRSRLSDDGRVSREGASVC